MKLNLQKPRKRPDPLVVDPTRDYSSALLKRTALGSMRNLRLKNLGHDPSKCVAYRVGGSEHNILVVTATGIVLKWSAYGCTWVRIAVGTRPAQELLRAER